MPNACCVTYSRREALPPPRPSVTRKGQMTQPSPMSPADASRAATAVLDAVETAVVGKRESLELVLTGILAGGHVLLEDLPGLGKTLAARSFAQVLGLPRSEERRVGKECRARWARGCANKQDMSG